MVPLLLLIDKQMGKQALIKISTFKLKGEHLSL